MSTDEQGNKNKTVLNDFVAYCEQHPGERFWQALRNWSGQSFILACDDIEGGRTFDTFDWEGFVRVTTSSGTSAALTLDRNSENNGSALHDSRVKQKHGWDEENKARD